jgi:iron complex outermembrane receptor protein
MSMRLILKQTVVAIIMALLGNVHTASAVEAEADGQNTNEPEAATEMPTIQVRAKADSGYAAKQAATATKTDTPLMETPVNIQVVTQQVMQDQQATTLDTVLNNVSGVISYEQSGNLESIIVRGFDTNQTIFLDGFRIYDHFGNGLQNLTNIESVEVMKGPAATLYGEAQPGGIVNLVSKQPQAVPYYAVELSAGSWSHFITKFDATGPLNEDKTLLYRLDGSYETSSSWRDGIWSRSTSITPTVKWIISPQTQATIKISYTHNPMNSDNAQIVPLVNNQIVPIPRTVNIYDPSQTWQTNDMTSITLDWSHQFNDDWTVKNKWLSYSAKSNGVFVNGSFVPPGTPGNIGSGWNAQLGYPAYGVGAASGQLSNEQNLATELDLTGHFTTAQLKHTLLLGADYAIHTEPVTVISGMPNSTPLVPVSYTASVPVYLDPNNLYSSDTRSVDKGLYVQDQVKLPHHVDILAGLRYQSWSQTSWSNLYGSTNVANGVAGYSVGTPYSDSAVTPRLGVVWEAQKWLSLYGQYSEGYFPNTALDYLGNTLKATGANDKEVGIKTETQGGRLKTTLDYFDLTKTNVSAPDTNVAHLALPNCMPGGPGCFITIGEVNSKGIELDVQGEVTPDWNVILTYAYTDARVTVDGNTPSLVGNRMQNVPFNMGSLWNTYDFRQGELAGWTLGGGAVARGSSVDSSNTVNTPGYVIFNAMARYSTKWNNAKLTAQLNINNLFNTDYFASSSYDYACNGCSYAGVTYGIPRSALATVRLEY